jgi:hypothetical protein
LKSVDDWDVPGLDDRALPVLADAKRIVGKFDRPEETRQEDAAVVVVNL